MFNLETYATYRDAYANLIHLHLCPISLIEAYNRVLQESNN